MYLQAISVSIWFLHVNIINCVGNCDADCDGCSSFAFSEDTC